MHKEQLTYDDVRSAFDKGTVLTASKETLEQLLIAVGKARILDPANQSRAAEMGETMRQLLAARQSQEIHRTSLVISGIALLVSLAALLVSLFQLSVDAGIVAPMKSHIISLEHEAPAPQQKAQQKMQQPSK